jgi:hypothetical protein
MTVKELKDKLANYPDDYPVFIPDNWDEHPYTFLQDIWKVNEVTTDSPDGGTFDWGFLSKQQQLDSGLIVWGLCLSSEPYKPGGVPK